MKKLILFFCILHAVGQTFAQNDSITLVNANWENKKINNEVTWKAKHFTHQELFNSNQNINIIEIKPFAKKVKLAVVFSDSLETTSRFAKKNNALVAINGSFFKMRGEDPDYNSKLNSVPKLEPSKLDKNRSVVYLRVNNEVIAKNDFGKDNKRRRHQTGAISISKDGTVSILKADSLNNDWENTITGKDVITSGPILLIKGALQNFPEDDFCNDRHPRTAVGVKSDGTIILLTVDGRMPLASGMNILELQKIFRWTGCVDALNLDGGGSTTLVIKDQPFLGVVNYPTDNKKFDHQGEREVANSLIIIEKD